jgi:6,7-dimethyl-8-ribityllumazine synthase
MAGAAPQIGIKKSPNLKVAIITAFWHQDICEALVSGAKRACADAEVKSVEVFSVPGSFELPLAAQYAFEAGFDVVVVVGLVLRGETPHFDYVCQGVTQGVMDVQLKFSKPIGFGVLMCDSIEQAHARSGQVGSKEDKGFDAAVAALSMSTLVNHK